MGPWLGLLQLCRQPEQRRLVTEGSEEVRSDRHTVLVPVEWDGHRRIAGQVGDDAGVANGRSTDLHRVPGVVRRGDHGSDGQWWRGHGWSEEHVKVLEELCDPPAEALGVLDG